MVVFQETKLQTRRVSRSTEEQDQLQCIAEYLPPNSIITARKEIASVDSKNFPEWANHFLRDTEPLRRNGEPILLLYDGHRSHLPIPVLELLAKSNVIGYALPAHTSGTTQLLDVSVFPSLKYHYRNSLDVVSRSRRRNGGPLDEFDVAQIIHSSYKKSFTVSNITSGLAKCGIWPLDDCRLFSQARPFSFEEPNRIATLKEMLEMMDREEDKTVDEIIEDVQVHQSGFLDTSYGAVLTTDAALSLLRLSGQARELARQKGLEVAAEKVRAEEIEKERRQVLRAHHERVDGLRRARKYGEAFVASRSLKVRRAIARSRAAVAKQMAVVS